MSTTILLLAELKKLKNVKNLVIFGLNNDAFINFSIQMELRNRLIIFKGK